MSRSRQLWIGMGAALFSALLVFGVYTVLIRQVELQKTVNVVVPRDFIRSGTLISRDMVEFRPVASGSIRKDMLQHIEDAVGKEAIVPLGTGEPILSWKVDPFHLLPNGEQATFQIPKEYILSLAGGVRAGDRVIVYASGKEETVRLLDHEVTVASVKSAGNVEVDDPEKPNLLARLEGDKEKMYASRRDANAAVEHINLNLTEEEWFAIDEACRSKQAKLVLAFRGTSILPDEEGAR